MYLSQRAFLGWRGGADCPWGQKSPKIYVVPTIMSQDHSCFVFFLWPCHMPSPPVQNPPTKHRIFSDTGKQLTSKPSNSNNTPSRPVPPVPPARPDIPSQESGNPKTKPAPPPQVSLCTTAPSHNTVLSGGLASEVGSGVGGRKGLCLGLTGGLCTYLAPSPKVVSRLRRSRWRKSEG
jgi:hypothetical protein